MPLIYKERIIRFESFDWDKCEEPEPNRTGVFTAILKLNRNHVEHKRKRKQFKKRFGDFVRLTINIKSVCPTKILIKKPVLWVNKRTELIDRKTLRKKRRRISCAEQDLDATHKSHGSTSGDEASYFCSEYTMVELWEHRKCGDSCCHITLAAQRGKSAFKKIIDRKSVV